jgi:hemerythrin
MPAPSVVSHDLGHPTLDAQHASIFQLQREIIAAFRAGDTEGGTTALHVLEKDMREHFVLEERLMRDSAYPERALHGEAHDLFRADFGKLIADIARGTSHSAVALWLESRLGSWWKLHVRTNDAALVRHLLAVPVAAVPPAPLAERAPPG